MKKLMNKFLGVKKAKVDKNDFIVKQYLQFHFEDKGFNKDSFNIHLIETKTKEKTVFVKIWLGRPGVFIGKGGETFDGIKKCLSDRLNKPVEIELKEFDVWR
jgi:ribosomal protein S3